MNRLALFGLVPLAFAAPATAQSMDNMSMPGMSMPMPAAKPHAAASSARAAHAKKRVPTSRRPHRMTTTAMSTKPGMAATAPASAADHAKTAGPGMTMPASPSDAGAGMANMPGMTPTAPAPPKASMADMPGMRMSPDTQAAAPTGEMPNMAEPEIPHGAPPSPPRDHLADHFFDPAAMAAARTNLRREHGGASRSKVMANLAEYQARSGGGYRWEGQAWFGGDINRFVVKTEGEGSRRGGLDTGEVQGLYSHAMSPYFNVQGGVRQDFAPHARTYATVGVEGLAPYWFDVEGAVFVSNRGEVLARAEATYDLRLSQRLILQPRVELNLAAQNSIETRTGAGLSNAEFGLRLRYEIRREFAPYIGVSYDRKLGKTADYARGLGQDPAAASFVFGVRAWF